MGTSRYNNIKSMNYDLLWSKCYEWSQAGNTILLSELEAPDFFDCIFEVPFKYTLGGNRVSKIERLFIFNKEKYEGDVKWK